jgi:STE24 endopeptidase
MRIIVLFAAVLISMAPTVAAAQTPSTGTNAPVAVPEPSAKALDLYHSGNILWAVNQVWALVLPAVFLVSGLSSWLRRRAERLGRYWFFTVAIYFILFFTLYCLLSMPLEYYEGYVRGHQYDLSNQTIGKWLHDEFMSWLIGLAAGCLLLWVPYWLVRKSPRRWWIYCWVLSVPFIFAVMIVLPIWIAPLFNDFSEMHNKPLESKILALAHRAGIDSDRVYEVNKSVDTKTMNAYVVGLFGSKRIVLYDTLLKNMDDRQVLFVMGHEMGHYVLGHILWGTLLSCLAAGVLFFLIHWLSGPILKRWGKRFGFDRLGDVASLPLVLLLANALAIVGTPVGLAWSRHIEHEADRFGLEITHDNHAGATVFVEFAVKDLGVPRPGQLYVWLRSSHPPLGERIDFCNSYRPWAEGKPERYKGLFRSQ